MINQLRRIPQRHRVVGFLVVTSVIGVLLLLAAVYNASRELEIISDVADVHRLASAQVQHTQSGLPAAGGDEVIADVVGADDTAAIRGRSVSLEALEASRINSRGGLLEGADGALVWSLVPIPGKRAQLLVARPYTPVDRAALAGLYAKRLIIPAAFYVWLMVWVGLIIRHFTARLASQKEEMEYMALHDTLSGLPNRNLLDDRLRQLIDVCERDPNHFALVLIDLDGFKTINDSLGHGVGDGILHQVGERLRSSIRPMDTAARVGGDEFVLLLDQVDEPDCEQLCRRLLDVLQRPFSVQDHILTVGASMGVAQYPRDGRQPERLRRNADIAMYQAKQAGGGVRFYEAGMRSVVA